jgi:hypothetical protein
MQTQPQSHSTPNIIQAPYLKLKSIQLKSLTTQVLNLIVKNQNSIPKLKSKIT